MLLVCLASIGSIALAVMLRAREMHSMTTSYVSVPVLSQLYLQDSTSAVFNRSLEDFQADYASSEYPIVYLRLNFTVFVNKLAQQPYVDLERSQRCCIPMCVRIVFGVSWLFESVAYDMGAQRNRSLRSSATECLLQKHKALGDWAATTCTSALVLDTRQFWGRLGIQLVWFTLGLVVLTIGAIAGISFDIVLMLVLPIARVVKAVQSAAEVFYPADALTDAVDEDDDDDEEDDADGLSKCESATVQIFDKQTILGDALETLEDALIGCERSFKLPLLPWRRGVRSTKRAISALDEIEAEALQVCVDRTGA